MAIVAIDCFCGCGGTTRGLLDSGIRVVKGIDVDPACEETYSLNNKPARFVCRDLTDMTPLELMENVKLDPDDFLLLSGCAPCQPFSKQRPKGEGEMEGSESQLSDGRRSLLLSFGMFVEALQPEFVFVENVPGIQKVAGNSTFRRFLRILETCGYNYDFGVVDAKKYGVPQSRARFILIASLLAPIEIPEPTHGKLKGLRPYRTVWSSISRLPGIRAGQGHRRIPNHVAWRLSEQNLKRIRATPPDGGDRRDWPERLRLKCHKGVQGHTDVYGRMWWDRPAPALTCRCVSLSNGRYGHPEQNRAISLREAAALQTFKADFKFRGSADKIASLIGNAVPVNFARVFGDVFQSCAKAVT